MIVRQAFRFELDPTRSQRVLLAKHIGAARRAWNWALARRQELYRTQEGKARFTDAVRQHKELNELKKTEFPWMYEVSKCAPQEALRDLDRAYRNFAAGRAKLPRFKKKFVHDSFRLTGAVSCGERSAVLPRLGKIRTKEPTTKLLAAGARITSATVSREADRWFVSFAVEVERPDPEPVLGPAVGVDLGLSCFAVVSTADGSEVERVESPKPLAAALRRLAKVQRKHARKKKGSANRRRSALRLARLHRRVGNRRKDFLHKFTTRLAKTKSAVVVEDLCVKGLVRTHLARSVSDAGWGEFRRQLGYKTQWYGSRLVTADRFFPSSKTCSSCGAVKEELSLSEREFVCEACGAVLDRDENAARNLARLAAGATGSSPESDACGETTAGSEERAPRGGRSGRRPRRSRKEAAPEPAPAG
jgi:putative transposase